MSEPSVALVRVPELAAVPYAYAAVPAAGTRLAFLAGACPIDADGATVAVGDPEGQARQALDNLTTALAALGATLGDVVSTRVLVASSERHVLGAVWEVVHDGFGEHEVPSTLIGVAALGYADQLVEIEAVAALRD